MPFDRQPFKIEIVDIRNGVFKRIVVRIWKFIKKYWKRYIW
tara:strand:- start:1584 stop:1706 length:123 start_codon:yes stop_codon:yes gene_type:complete